jgi:predicted RNA-binding protein
MENGFCPARRTIQFFPSTEASILPLIPALAFIRNKHQWGAVFRFGVVEIAQADYERIAGAMHVRAVCTAPHA